MKTEVSVAYAIKVRRGDNWIFWDRAGSELDAALGTLKYYREIYPMSDFQLVSETSVSIYTRA